MDPLSIIETAYSLAKGVKELLDNHVEAREQSEQLAEMIQVHILILENIRHVKNETFAIIIKQYSMQIESLQVELQKRQGTSMFKKLKKFFKSEAFLTISKALEDKMMKIQVTLLTVIGTSNGASPSPTAAGAPAQQTMGDAPAVEMQAVEVIVQKEAAAVPEPAPTPAVAPAPEQQVPAAAQVVPVSGSGVEPSEEASEEPSVQLSEADVAAIRGSLNAENIATIKAVPIRKRGHIFCHNAQCGQMHAYKRTFNQQDLLGSFCLGPIYMWCWGEQMSPELTYTCSKDEQKHIVSQRQCGQCEEKHAVRVQSTFWELCPAWLPLCGVCIMIMVYKGKPYYQHGGERVHL